MSIRTRTGCRPRSCTRLQAGWRGLTVVGDDAQAIYSFRAAAVENILGFPDRFKPRAEVVTLAQNYRSTQPVLDVANALMAEAPRQHRKHLLSVRGGGPRPRVVTRATTSPRRLSTVCSEVLRRRESNVPLQRQAVLFRTRSHSDLLEMELAQAQDPLREIRRPQVPGGRARQGSARACCAGRTIRATPSRRSVSCSSCPAWGREMHARRIDHFEASGYSFAALQDRTPPQPSAVDLRKLSDLMLALVEAERAWPARCTWCASGTSRTSSASTSTSTPASAISTSSSCCRVSTLRASGSSRRSRSIRRMRPVTLPATRAAR